MANSFYLLDHRQMNCWDSAGISAGKTLADLPIKPELPSRWSHREAPDDNRESEKARGKDYTVMETEREPMPAKPDLGQCQLAYIQMQNALGDVERGGGGYPRSPGRWEFGETSRSSTYVGRDWGFTQTILSRLSIHT
jgi:hypothetical protein